MFWPIAGILLIGAALWGPLASNVEQARYNVIEKKGRIEIRAYAPMIVAETSVSGERDAAINEGFRIIADYIFGNNTSAQKVAMTAPVTQQASSEKIAMTAPVTQSGDANSWSVRFVMPADYTMETLPKPNNPAVHIRQIPASRYAVARFSGSTSTANLESHKAELQSFLAANHIKTLSQPTYAFFNPPWTLPFMRRNEVMAEIE